MLFKNHQDNENFILGSNWNTIIASSISSAILPADSLATPPVITPATPSVISPASPSVISPASPVISPATPPVISPASPVISPASPVISPAPPPDDATQPGVPPGYVPVYNKTNGRLNISYGNPDEGWTLGNYIGQATKMGPYPPPISGTKPNPPAEHHTQILPETSGNWPNLGCPAGTRNINCVDYDPKEGGMYPNCDINMYGFTCGLPTSLAFMTARRASATPPELARGLINDASYNLFKLVSPNVAVFDPVNATIQMQSPTATAWNSKFPSTISPPNELVIPVRWNNVFATGSMKPAYLDGIRGVAENMQNESAAPSGAILLAAGGYKWRFDNVQCDIYLKYVTPTITNGRSEFGRRLQGFALRLPPGKTFPLDGAIHSIQIDNYASTVMSFYHAIDYSFCNSTDTYCSIQTLSLGPRCFYPRFVGTTCYVSDLPAGTTYCDGDQATGTVSCFSA